MTTLIHHEFTFGDIVYCRSDPEQSPMQVYGIVSYPGNSVLYKCSSKGNSAEFYEFELSKEKIIF